MIGLLKEFTVMFPDYEQSIYESIYNLKPADVIGPADVTKQKYDIILVDEAHRLHQYKNIVNRKIEYALKTGKKVNYLEEIQ